MPLQVVEAGVQHFKSSPASVGSRKIPRSRDRVAHVLQHRVDTHSGIEVCVLCAPLVGRDALPLIMISFALYAQCP